MASSFPFFGTDFESQYRNLVSDVIYKGEKSEDRTGVGTRFIFGTHIDVDLELGFPLLTSRKIFFRGMVEELLWMIRGDTNAKHLSDVGVKIWDANSARPFLDKRGLEHYEEGDLGPVYGFQWRHFGAEYVDCNTDYTGAGVDQLSQCIQQIKTNPSDRRIIMSAWNPADLDKMALVPCHMGCQFRVTRGKLSTVVTQRSADLGLGVPFNIASYALLTHLIAEECKLGVGRLRLNMGDTHVYENHVPQLEELLGRGGKKLPTLRLALQPSIFDYKSEHIIIEDYNPYPQIKMEMAV